MLSGVVKESSFQLRIFFLTSSELGLALKGFVLKVIPFYVIEFLVCQPDDSRAVCRLVERGFSSPPSPYCCDGFSGDSSASPPYQGSLMDQCAGWVFPTL